MARILSRYSSDRVALELWNEPAISQARRAEWETAQTRMYLAVRAAAPSLTLVLTGIGGSLHSLLSIDASVLRDSNIYYTFHYYEPAPFTHQGLVSAQDNQNVEQFFHDVPFPLTADQAEVAIIGAIGRAHVRAHDNAALRARLVDKVNDYRRYLPLTLNEAAIAQQFDKVVVWTHANGITRSQILLGEFGVMRPHVDPDARLRWIDIVRRQAERCGFGWCRWSFDNPASMGMTKNPDLVHFSPGELTALGLHEE
ncbi:MAG: hypothetical protein B7Z22_11035 [Hyphomonas sp. 32-62-5]|nr:MAG: hypothetical protein B7Z22_11035 [Hyphomonas sp. 32-62-5]